MDRGTILQRNKRSVKMSKREVLLILRAYQSHPKNWSDVLEEIRENLQLLPNAAAELYRTSTLKKLRYRMVAKFGKLLSCERDTIQDIEIRTEIVKIKEAKRRLVHRSGITNASQDVDRRDEIVQILSDSSDQLPHGSPEAVADEQPQQKGGPQPGPVRVEETHRRPGSRKRSQGEYYEFLTKKIPKLLRQLLVNGSDEETS